MLPPLADVVALGVRAGSLYEGDELRRAEAVLADASSLIRAEAGQDWIDALGDPSAPDVVVAMVLKVALRAMENPHGLNSESYPEYSWRRDGAEDGVYLTDRECRVVRRAGGKTGLWTQATTRLDTENDTVWVEDNFGAEPFPIYASEDLA